MRENDYIRLELPSLSINESFARQTVAVYATRLDPTLEELGDIKTAVSEAVTNCIVHAYPDVIGTILIKVRVIKGDVLEVTVRDKGVGIKDLKKAMEPLFTTGGEERSGMGFTIMESFMDSVKVKTAEGKGTSVVMRRRVIPKTIRR